jgi:hypothetical protein
MAKKSKDTTASSSEKPDNRTPADPIKARNLVRLLNILALILAIIAFLLQFFAVITHRWKWQVTSLRPIVTSYDRQVQYTAYDDSRLDQRYGLFSRDIKLFGHHDEQLAAWASTRFPRVDDDEEHFHACLSETSSLRGVFLTCSDRLQSPDQCHCRRYPHWNAVIFFEIFALVLLGLLVVICSLLNTQFHGLLKPIGVLLALLTFIFLLLGLIILLSYMKRETRTIADIYPHTYYRFADKVGLATEQRYQTVLHKAIRRQAQESYRAYSLLPGQHPHNSTHYQEFSTSENNWVYKPYSSMNSSPYLPRAQQNRFSPPTTTRRTTTQGPVYNAYGPIVSYDHIFENTRAGIGWSTVLSILSMLVALILPLILALSWLTGKKLGPEVQTVTTTTVKTEYVTVPHETTVETVPLTQTVPIDYESNRGDSVVIMQDTRQSSFDNHGGQSVSSHGQDEQATALTYRT